MATPASKTAELVFAPLSTEALELTILGTTPFICNRMSQKARRQLLLPDEGRGRGNTAARAATAKHDPIGEYRASFYRTLTPEAPTVIAALASMFKGSMKQAALDVPGATKRQIGQLLWVEGERLPLFGVPKLIMAVVRNSDIARTPDIRSRAILPAWTTTVTIRYVVPLLKAPSVVNLQIAAGMITGVGDWRPEKGSGTYGQFEVVSAEDPRVQRLRAEGGRAAQERALAEPSPYDDETEDLLDWYESEYLRRNALAPIDRNGAAELPAEEEIEVLA